MSTEVTTTKPTFNTALYEDGAGGEFARMMKEAEVLSHSQMLPAKYAGKPQDCLVALHMAKTMNCDPLMILQNLYIVHGQPSFSAKFLTATFNSCGRYTSVKYRYSGTPGQMDYGCVAYATERETGEVIESIRVTMQMAKDEGWLTKTGSKWKTMPDLMLSYRAATFLCRMYAPELSMGFQTVEELQDITPDVKQPTFTPGVQGLKQRLKITPNYANDLRSAQSIEEVEAIASQIPEDLQHEYIELLAEVREAFNVHDDL
jgi:hypothetical protein